MEEKIRKERESVMDEIRQLTASVDVGNVSTTFKLGNPAEEIVNFVDEEDLIVMASHGKKGLNKFILGSVSEEVIRGAPCSVMIIKPKTP